MYISSRQAQPLGSPSQIATSHPPPPRPCLAGFPKSPNPSAVARSRAPPRMAKALSLSDPPAKDAEKANAEMKMKIAAEDAEKANAEMKMKIAAEEEEVDVVDARKASLIRLALDVFFRVYLLFCVGMVAVMIMVSDNWWDPWPGVLFLSPICIGTLWLTPKMKDVFIQLYATRRVSKSDCDLSIKLLLSEKQANK